MSVRVGSVMIVCLASACHTLPVAQDNASTTPTCASDADCGIREHAKQVVCQHGDFCMAICEDHWGDCNDDYRDGCEEPIEHRVYCKGDSRIREYSPATIDLYQDAHAGPGELDATGFDRVLERSKSTLQSCYDRALVQDAKLEVTLRYRFSIDQDREQLTAGLIAGEPRSSLLESCVDLWTSSIRLEQLPKNGPVTFDYRIVFVHSRREGD